MLRKLFLISCISVGMLWVVTTGFNGEVATAEAGGCQPTPVSNPCPANPAPGVHYRGTANPPTIEVTICISYWNDLRGDPRKRERWWGLRYERGAWGDNIQEIYSQCTTRNAVRGTIAGNMNDCCESGRWVWRWTEPMVTEYATYWIRCDARDQHLVS